jgi:uncharacterized repeat protein (TIGR03899 family)
MEVKDLFGLSQPMTKLVEVVSSGVGRVTRSYFSKKDADAKAYEIRKLAEALNDSKKLLGTGTFTNEELSVSFTEQPEILRLESSIEERSIVRSTYQEAKKQLNTESITQYAAEELQGKESVSDEKVDEDWIARFFKIAEDIGNEEMQVLWGKVLAGEVARPKSYSLRTLDILKNITTREAEVFAKVARAALVGASGAAFIFNPDPNDCAFLKGELGIGFDDLLLLREIGLLQPTSLQFNMLAGKTNISLIYGSKVIVIERQAEVPLQILPVEKYTTVGAELVPLVSISESIGYIQKLASFIKRDGVVIKYADITYYDGENILYDNTQEVPPLADAGELPE